MILLTDFKSLGAIITIAGIIFFTICLAIIILGKKVGDKNTKQKITVGKYFEVDANSIIVLVLISAFIIIFPLGMYYWKIGVNDYIPIEEVNKNYIPMKGIKFQLTVQPLFGDKRLADSVFVTLIKTKGLTNDTLVKDEMIDESYDFNNNIEHDVEYTWLFNRKGYSLSKIRYKFNDVRYPIVLTKK